MPLCSVEDVNVRHFLAINGKSPLHYAVKLHSALTSGIDSGRTDVVKWLLAQGVGEQPL